VPIGFYMIFRAPDAWLLFSCLLHGNARAFNCFLTTIFSFERHLLSLTPALHFNLSLVTKKHLISPTASLFIVATI
jgi:hypothetical protein